MNDRDRRRYERLTRVQTFGRERAAEFTAGSIAGTAFANIDRLIVELDRAKADQIPERVDKQVPTRLLVLTCQMIATTARAVAQHDSKFSGTYRLPANLTDIGLQAHVDALLAKFEDHPSDDDPTKTAKSQLRARFTAYELPQDFVETLRRQREDVRAAEQLNQSETQDGVENTSLIGTHLTRANTEVKDLDAVMVNKYSAEPEKLQAWRRASRVEAAPKRAASAAPGMGGSGPAGAKPS
ncbi:MAG: hypothetical protein NVS9B10_27740 [Nevskia sp.]